MNHLATSAVLLATLTACSTVEQRAVGTDDEQHWLPDVAWQSIDRHRLVLRLGPPSAVFEGGRVFTWQLAEHEDTLLPVVPIPAGDASEVTSWGRARFSLVVAFDERGRATRHALIAVR